MEIPFFTKKKENFSFDNEPELSSLSDSESFSMPKNFDDKKDLGEVENHGLGELPKNASVTDDEYRVEDLEKENQFGSNIEGFGPSSYGKNLNEESPKNNSSTSDNKVLNAKIETIEAKISLAQANISNIEHKIDTIYKMVALEISDETKRTLKINDMKDSLKKI